MVPLLPILIAGAGMIGLSGCTGSTNGRRPDDTGTPVNPNDADGDGVDKYSDCDDNDPDVGADYVDVYADADEDGYGDPDGFAQVCAGTAGYVADNADCDDGNPAVHPDQAETCNNGVDDNCDATDNQTCELSGEMSLADADFKLEGSREDEEFGYPLAPAGDVNGDGYPDALVGVRYLMDGSDETGGVKIISGGEVDSPDFGSVLATLYGENDGDWFGYDVSQFGTEILVGAPRESSVTTYNGAAYIFDTSLSGTVYAEDAVAKLYDDEYAAGVGYAVDDRGDVTGDGVSDAVLGAVGYGYAETFPYAQGAVYVAAGPLEGDIDLTTQYTAFLKGGSDVDSAGCDVATGDVDGNGTDDVIIGACNNMNNGNILDWGNPSWYIGNGAVYVVSGPVEGYYDLAADATATLLGPTAGERAGSKLDVGDEDGDGNADLLIGAPIKYGDGGEQGTGATYLVHGPVSGDIDLADAETEFTASYAYAYIGAAVAFAGDVNGDGYMDVALGGSDATDRGTAYLCYGPFPSGIVDVDTFCEAMDGENESDYAGFPVSGVGDLDQDGFDDLMTGAIGYQERQFKGAAYIVRGRGM